MQTSGQSKGGQWVPSRGRSPCRFSRLLLAPLASRTEWAGAGLWRLPAWCSCPPSIEHLCDGGSFCAELFFGICAELGVKRKYIFFIFIDTWWAKSTDTTTQISESLRRIELFSCVTLSFFFYFKRLRNVLLTASAICCRIAARGMSDIAWSASPLSSSSQMGRTREACQRCRSPFRPSFACRYQLINQLLGGEDESFKRPFRT